MLRVYDNLVSDNLKVKVHERGDDAAEGSEQTDETGKQ